MLPVLPTIERVVAPVPSTVVELVTLDWLSRMTEPPEDGFEDTVPPLRDVMLPGETVLPSRDVMLPDETVLPSRDVIVPPDTVLPSRDVIVPAETVLPSREMILLDVPSVITLCAKTLVQKLRAATVTRCFISAPPG
jgi:hypothetical protein